MVTYGYYGEAHKLSPFQLLFTSALLGPFHASPQTLLKPLQGYHSNLVDIVTDSVTILVTMIATTSVTSFSLRSEKGDNFNNVSIDSSLSTAGTQMCTAFLCYAIFLEHRVFITRFQQKPQTSRLPPHSPRP